MCLDPSKTGQTRNPIQAAHLALVEMVVAQLTVTVDLAAFFPRLQEQIGLSLVLVGSPAQRVLQPSEKFTGIGLIAENWRDIGLRSQGMRMDQTRAAREGVRLLPP